jgi:serine/threonine-protein kinase
MLTGRLPFEAKDPAGWLMKHLREPPPHLHAILPTAPDALDRLVFDLMAKDPAERPVDAHRVQALLVIIAGSLTISIPAQLTESAEPLSASPRSVRDPWERRVDLFQRMLARSFPAGPPLELGRTLDAIRARLQESEARRAGAVEEQQRLAAIEHEAREGRLRLGRAMDALTADVSKTREEARALRNQVVPLSQAADAFGPRAIAAHKELVIWEGRSGFREPHRELAAAYRRLADLVDAWIEARKRELAAEAEAVKKERLIADVDFQIRSLRESLSNLDRNVDERRQQSLAKIAQTGRLIQQLEGELLQLASRFCAPLRGRAELGPLFYELERETPTVAQQAG